MEWGLLLLYITLPFIQIGGESAFRFDVPTLKLHFFGTALWMQEFYYVLLATLSFVFLFLFTTLVYGRVWCGWMCPQTIYTDLSEKLHHLGTKGVASRIASHLVLAACSLFIGFITVCYFVSPYQAVPDLLQWKLGPIASGSTIVMGILLYLDLAFLRRTFCATICPYAKLQGAMTDETSLIIGMDEARREECIHCHKCCRVCPTDLDIRKGMQVGCVMCAGCIDACESVMQPKGKKGLIQYQFGSLKQPGFRQLLRPIPVLLLSLSLLFCGILIYQGYFRAPFDFSVLPHTMEPKKTRSGGVINAFLLSIKNREDTDITIDFIPDPEALKDGIRFSITTALKVPAGRLERFPLLIRSQSSFPASREIHIRLREREGDGYEMDRQLYFVSPN